MWEHGLANGCLKLIGLGELLCDDLNDAGNASTIYADLCVVTAALPQDPGHQGKDLSNKQCQKSLQLRQKRVYELLLRNKLGRTNTLRRANAWNDVGVAMIHDSDIQNATPFFEESLHLKKTQADEISLLWHFGETHRNLASVLLAQGRIEEAKLHAHHATDLCSQNLPEQSAAVQDASYIEGLVLMNCGEQDKALRIGKKKSWRVENQNFGRVESIHKGQYLHSRWIVPVEGKIE